MEKYIADYMVYLEANHYAVKTRQAWRGMLQAFVLWLKSEAVENPEDITEEQIISYQEHLKEKINRFGKKESINSQRKNLDIVKVFLEYLKDKQRIFLNPAEHIKLPRIRKYLPSRILTKDEAELVLAKPDVTTTLGLRDRVMLELLYATGMRRIELCNLRLGHIDFKEQTIEIRNSKGAKDRFIPVSGRALGWLDKYLSETRPKICSEQSKDFVFLNCHKRPFTNVNVGTMLKKYFIACDLGHMGACHVFRHTFATQMLEAGVDLRLIQEMLGHTDIKVTQIYTRVSIRKLQEVHEKTHPARPKGMSKRHLEEKTSGQSDEDELDTI